MVENILESREFSSCPFGPLIYKMARLCLGGIMVSPSYRVKLHSTKLPFTWGELSIPRILNSKLT